MVKKSIAFLGMMVFVFGLSAMDNRPKIDAADCVVSVIHNVKSYYKGTLMVCETKYWDINYKTTGLMVFLEPGLEKTFYNEFIEYNEKECPFAANTFPYEVNQSTIKFLGELKDEFFKEHLIEKIKNLGHKALTKICDDFNKKKIPEILKRPK